MNEETASVRDQRRKLLLVGNRGGTNIGESFLRAASQMQMDVSLVDARIAMGGNRAWRAVSWHLLGHRPPRLGILNRIVRKALRDEKPELLVSAGICGLDSNTLLLARELGVRTAVYVTDDPWAKGHSASWFHESIPHYDAVFTPRKRTIGDFVSEGARNVEHLPFAYDPELWFLPEDVPPGSGPDVLFVGGGDTDRAELLAPLLRTGLNVAIHGSCWPRFSKAKRACLGQAPPENLRRLTRAAKINLCLVRRSNRDEHVMRSFEIPAAGGCVLAEDTDDHRQIFGDTAMFFEGAEDLVRKTDSLLSDEALRGRLSEACRRRVATEENTYTDRLKRILACEARLEESALDAN